MTLTERIDALERTLETERGILQDANAVRVNMLRGTIAWTPETLRHVLGDDGRETERLNTISAALTDYHAKTAQDGFIFVAAIALVHAVEDAFGRRV